MICPAIVPIRERRRPENLRPDGRRAVREGNARGLVAPATSLYVQGRAGASGVSDGGRLAAKHPVGRTGQCVCVEGFRQAWASAAVGAAPTKIVVGRQWSDARVAPCLGRITHRRERALLSPPRARRGMGRPRPPCRPGDRGENERDLDVPMASPPVSGENRAGTRAIPARGGMNGGLVPRARCSPHILAPTSA
jgi:hypothetical protein